MWEMWEMWEIIQLSTCKQRRYGKFIHIGKSFLHMDIYGHLWVGIEKNIYKLEMSADMMGNNGNICLMYIFLMGNICLMYIFSWFIFENLELIA